MSPTFSPIRCAASSSSAGEPGGGLVAVQRLEVRVERGRRIAGRLPVLQRARTQAGLLLGGQVGLVRVAGRAGVVIGDERLRPLARPRGARG